MSDNVRRLMLPAAAFFAIGLALVRASIQSITIDEATTYLAWIWPVSSSHDLLQVVRRLTTPASNNHILNSILIYLSTQIFGTSELTVRLPALIGATLYITGCYRICRLLSPIGSILPLTLFVCLVYNPFIFDYLVAARGYALALGFLMWAIAVPAKWFLADAANQARSVLKACGIASTCIGLSITANFAFAFADFVTLTAIFLWAATRKVNLGLVLVYCYLPCSMVVLILSGFAMIHMPSRELVWGATSLGETFGTIMEASLYRLPFGFMNRSFTRLIWLLFGVTSSALFCWVLFRLERNFRLFRFALVMVAIIAVTGAIHYAIFRRFWLPLPKGRTASYFFPLSISAVGALAAIPLPTGVGRCLRGSVLGTLLVMATCFLLCLRLTYFEEWPWNADVKDVYSVLDRRYRDKGLRYVWCGPMYTNPLNFYRYSKHSSLSASHLNEFESSQAYVFNTLLDHDRIRACRNSSIIYRRSLPDGSETIIAVKN